MMMDDSIFTQDGPFFIVLVGLPGVGKSTFRRRVEGWAQVLSTDDYVEEVARQAGTTYDSVWEDTIKEATKVMQDEMRMALMVRKDLVVDRTNTSSKRRKGMLSQVPKDYHKVAIVFPKPEPDEWARRLDRPGKHLPPAVLESLERSFTYPTVDEGFDQVFEWNSL